MLSLVIASFLAYAEVPHFKLKLNSLNTVVWRGEVSGESVSKMQQDLISLHRQRAGKDYKIYLVMDSPGGSVYDGLGFIEFAKTIPNVDTISMFAASMASAIVQGIPGTRYVTPNGIMMYHRARGGFEGQFEDGEIEQQLKLWKKIVRGMETTNANRIGIPLADYKDKVKDEWWLYGEDNVEEKSADAVLHISCSQELIDEEDSIVVRGFLSVAEIKFSRCPLFRSPL